MRRRDFMKAVGTAAAALAVGRPEVFADGAAASRPATTRPAATRPAGDAKGKPNILFILADDQTYTSIRALGNREIQTPNLDRLVEAGTTFTHAYNQGAWHGAVCVASRCMLNTGRFLWNARTLDSSVKLAREVAAGRFWPKILATAGYQTYMTGKWHVKIAPEKAFDTVRDPRPGMPKQTPQGYDRPKISEFDPWKPWDKKRGGYWEGGRHWSEVVGDHGVRFLSQAARSDKPFFMYLAFNAPHDPRQSPKSYVDKYPLDKIRVPNNYWEQYPYMDAMGCSKKLRDERLAPFPRTKYAVKVNRREYYAIISHMDAQVGRILDALEDSGKADNTYVFFTSDHGLAVGHHGLMGEQNLHDHSVRVPLIVTGPAVPNDKRITTPVYLQDVMPATLELAGVDKPDYVQFKSLMPVIRGKRESNYDAIYGGYMTLQRMVTQGDFKLILYPKAKAVLLFNIKEDPDEIRNLAADPKFKAAAKALFTKLLDLQKQTGDTLDLKKAFPDL